MLLVSILIPLYNSEKYIAKTIDSALAQTYENTEILIFDDGSTDNSLSIASKYESKYENVKVFTHDNRGAQVTRNKLFELSSGTYIQYLDADDLLDKNKIKNQMLALKGTDYKTIAFSKCSDFEGENLNFAVLQQLSIYKNYDDPIRLLIDMWTKFEPLAPHAWLVSRKLLSEVGDWNLTLTKNQDGEFFARVISKSKKVVFVAEALIYYRLDSQSSISKNMSYQAMKSILLSFGSYGQIVKQSKNTGELKLALARQYSNFMFLIYPSQRTLFIEAEQKLKQLGFDSPVPIRDSNWIYILHSVIGGKMSIKVLKFVKIILHSTFPKFRKRNRQHYKIDN